LPELPEVETTAEDLRRLLIARTIRGVWTSALCQTLCQNVQADDLHGLLIQRTFTSVQRHGKLLLLGLDDRATLAIHRGMSGNVIVCAPEVERERHTHLVLGLSDERQLRLVDPRRFGRLAYFPDDLSRDEFVRARIGRDALDPLRGGQLGQLLVRRHGPIKPVLLNQRLLGGIGNIYADEVLWSARVHPTTPANALSTRQYALLASAIHDVLTQAVERRGTSFSDYVDGQGNPGENQEHLEVYGRTGQPCHRCGRLIQRMVLGGRGTHYCPRCQRPRPELSGTSDRSASLVRRPTPSG
jgi:formamidopyrimidine-DNA glycosylase